MTKKELLQKLQQYTDPKFKFNSKYHQYSYQGEKYTSVTTFIKKFSRKFDYEYWVTKKSKELGVTVEELKEDWQRKTDHGNYIGTATHNWIENYFNNNVQSLPTDLEIIERINKFNLIYATHLYKLDPVIFEQKVFSPKLKLAGTIDSLFLWKGKVIMIDHKTNKKFTTHQEKEGRYEEMLFPFENYYKNNLLEYSIQLSLYSLILEEIGVSVASGYLLYIGPDTETDEGEVIYQEPKLHRAFDLRPELKLYFKDIYELDIFDI